MESDFDALRQLPLFANLPRENLTQLAKRVQHRHPSRGETVFSHGDPGSALYFICSGEVKISVRSPTGSEIILALLGPGDAFGELALLDGLARSASAMATEDSDLLVLFREDFLGLLAAEPAPAKFILQSLAAIIRRMNEKLADVAMLDGNCRVVKALLELAERYGRNVDDGVEIDRDVTIDELAGLAGLYPGEVERIVRSHQYEGTILWMGNQITLRDADRLRSWL